MYYLAAIDSSNKEVPCDSGFDMPERIILDECFKSLKKIPPGLVREKRFCIYEEKPGLKGSDIIGCSAVELCRRHGIHLSYDNCFATVLDREILLTTLRSIWLKIYNSRNWRCSKYTRQFGLFDSVIKYDPYTMRNMLSEHKYGSWDHDSDRENALQVLYRFSEAINAFSDFEALVLYDEIFCSRWDCSGEIGVDPSGNITNFYYLGEGNGYSYLYIPRVSVWQRR